MAAEDRRGPLWAAEGRREPLWAVITWQAKRYLADNFSETLSNCHDRTETSHGDLLSQKSLKKV